MSNKSTVPPGSEVAAFVSKRLKEIGKSQKQAATECGFENANVMSMIKCGLTKVPLDRIGALATALEVDSAFLVRVVLREYMPTLWPAIEHSMHGPVLSKNERELIETLRTASGETDPAFKVAAGGEVTWSGTHAGAPSPGITATTTEHDAILRGRTLRYCVLDPVSGWRNLPLNRSKEIYQGKLAVPEFTGLTIIVAEVILVAEQDEQTQIISISPMAWQFDANGLVDQLSVMATVQAKLNQEKTHEAALSEESVLAITRLLVFL
jgi:hypothetical protein